MKIFFVLLSLICILLPKSVQAHALGQPPFFKANGVYTDLYPVPTTSLTDFYLPQDITKDNFLVNENIDFEIDIQALPVPPEIVEKTTFTWDFGDGTQARGIKNSHKYSKPGTYFMELKADSGDGNEPQLLQSTAINILPFKDYRLPKAVVEVNGKQSKDPLLDILETDFSKEITFEGSKSEAGSSEITEYYWDLGNGNFKSEVKFKYKYPENPYAVFPVLRIKTKDGFVSDGYVQLSAPLDSPTGKSALFDFKTIALAAALSLAITAALFFIYTRFISRRR
jgi:hypothetical protein